MEQHFNEDELSQLLYGIDDDTPDGEENFVPNSIMFDVLRKSPRHLTEHDEDNLLRHAISQMHRGFTVVQRGWNMSDETLHLGAFCHDGDKFVVSAIPVPDSKARSGHNFKSLKVRCGDDVVTFVKNGKNQSTLGRISYKGGKSSSPFVAWIMEVPDPASPLNNITIVTTHVKWYAMENSFTWYVEGGLVRDVPYQPKRYSDREKRPPLPCDRQYVQTGKRQKSAQNTSLLRMPPCPIGALFYTYDEEDLRQKREAFLRHAGLAVKTTGCSVEVPVTKIPFDVSDAKSLFELHCDASHADTAPLVFKNPHRTGNWCRLILNIVKYVCRTPDSCLVLKEVHLVRRSDHTPPHIDWDADPLVDPLVDYVTVSCHIDSGHLLAFPSLLHPGAYVPDSHKRDDPERAMVFFFQVWASANAVPAPSR